MIIIVSRGKDHERWTEPANLASRGRAPEDVTTLWFDCPGRSQNVLDAVAFDELDQCLARIEDDSSMRRRPDP